MALIKHKSLIVLEEVVLRDEASMNRMKDLIDGSRLSVRNLCSEATSFRNTGNYLINTQPHGLAEHGLRGCEKVPLHLPRTPRVASTTLSGPRRLMYCTTSSTTETCSHG